LRQVLFSPLLKYTSAGVKFIYGYVINETEMKDYILEQALNIGLILSLEELQEVLDVERIHLKNTGELTSFQ
jgi:hypothetical protein